MNSYIDKIKSLVSKRLDNSIVVHLLSLIRKELEVTNQLKNSSFNALRLFCDWALHNQIDRSDIGSSVIIDINKIVGIMQNIPNNAMLIEFISTLLLERFRNQIKNFFQENSIENQITNDEQWKVFLRFLFSSLEETPLLMRNSQKQELEQNPISPDLWIEQISITKNNFGESLKQEIYALNLLTSKGWRIIVPLTPR